MKHILSLLNHNSFKHVVMVANPEDHECYQDTAIGQSHDVSQRAGQTTCALLFSQAGYNKVFSKVLKAC